MASQQDFVVAEPPPVGPLHAFYRFTLFVDQWLLLLVDYDTPGAPLFNILPLGRLAVVYILQLVRTAFRPKLPQPGLVQPGKDLVVVGRHDFVHRPAGVAGGANRKTLEFLRAHLHRRFQIHPSVGLVYLDDLELSQVETSLGGVDWVEIGLIEDVHEGLLADSVQLCGYGNLARLLGLRTWLGIRVGPDPTAARRHLAQLQLEAFDSRLVVLALAGSLDQLAVLLLKLLDPVLMRLVLSPPVLVGLQGPRGHVEEGQRRPDDQPDQDLVPDAHGVSDRGYGGIPGPPPAQGEPLRVPPSRLDDIHG